MKFLRRFEFYRRLRGGVWERWFVDADTASLWFGPLSLTYSERVERIKAIAAEHGPPFALRFAFLLARPNPLCRGLPIVTDYRPVFRPDLPSDDVRSVNFDLHKDHA